MTRCKFKVESTGQTAYGESFVASPVYGDTPENKSFWTATPCGRLELSGITNGSLAAFKVGTEFYLDLTLVGGE